MMHLIAVVIIGFFVGIVAKFLTPGRDPGGFVLTALLGIAGSLVASYLGRTLGWYGPTDPAGFVASVVGAIIVLLVYRLIAHRT